jgi:hypothetical protein
MADIGRAMRVKLNATAAVTALTTTRIQPEPLPQGETLPAITYAITDGQSIGHMGGKSETAWAEIEYTAFADTYEAATAVAEVIRKAIDRFRGTTDSVTVLQCFAGKPETGIDTPVDGSDAHRYWHKRAYKVFYREDI